MHRLRIAPGAQTDLERLFDFLAEHDLAAAQRARAAIEKAYGFIEAFPFAGRKVDAGNPFLRESVISFGNAGYVALFEIDDDDTVTILAFRHQREHDLY
nr:type II toxin-antitoxin system RelE/ParE family toxin [Nevskia sp.]